MDFPYDPSEVNVRPIRDDVDGPGPPLAGGGKRYKHMDAGIIWLVVVLVLAILVTIFAPEPAKSKGAQVGGIAFLLWILVKLFAFLVGGAGKMP